MKKRLLQAVALLIMLITLSVVIASCSDGTANNGESETDSDGEQTVWDEESSEPVERGEVPELPLGENTVVVTADELLTKIREGTLKNTDDYAVTEGEPIAFGSSDRNQTYDMHGAVIRLAVRSGEFGMDLKSARGMTLKNAELVIYGDTGIGTEKARDCTVSDIKVTGNCITGIYMGGTDNAVYSCSVGLSDGTAAIQNGIVAAGESISISECTVLSVDNGIADKSKNGTVAEGNTVTGCQTAIVTFVPDSVIWYNVINGGDTGIKASFEKSEISAAMSSGYNIMAAKNTVSGTETSILFENVSNGVILLNTADTVKAVGCTNIYVVENTLSGRMTLTDNDYIIANENSYVRLKQSGNTNVNGDNLTDVNIRNSTGANSELLPHVNNEQFVGMVRKNNVRSMLGDGTLEEYVKKLTSSGDKDVIIPPGAYSFNGISLSGLEGVTVYGYGVLAEMGISKANTAFSFTECENCNVNGLFIGVSVYAHTQGTVVRRTTNMGTVSVEFIADPGYRQDFSDTYYFGDTANGFYFIEGRTYPNCDFTYTSKSYDSKTNTNVLNGVSQKGIAVGDRVAMRSNFSANGVGFYTCSGMVVEDVTVFSCSHFAEYDVDNDVAPVLHRFAVAAGPAPTLTGTEDDYKDFEDIIWRDSYGRLRSAEPMLTSCDATHSVNERVGIQIISSLFERLADDAGNINATYGLATRFDASTNTLYYTSCNVNTYKKLPGTFRVGDTVVLYSFEGEQIYYGRVTSATVDCGDGTYSVKLGEGITLPSGSVVVQNVSVSGGGFLIDNVLVRDVGCNGFRIKAPSGEVKNSTFERVSKGGLNCVPEYQLWPECGFITDGLKILNNVFNEVGFTSRENNLENKPVADTVWCSPILIRSELLASDSSKADYQSDTKYLMHRNIEISGNVFNNRWCAYAICMGAVDGVKITDNSFGDCKTDAYDSLPPILLLGGNNIEISDNTYDDAITEPYQKLNYGNITNLKGTDLAN